MKWFRRRTAAGTGECRYWQDLLARLGMPGVSVREVIRVSDGYQVHCRCRSWRPVTAGDRQDMERRLAVHKRLAKGAVRSEDDPAGTIGDFIVHVQAVAPGGVMRGQGG